MSDRLSSVEIEDVLSSIRRLVSDDLRPKVPDAPAVAEKLLLTPALRVVQDVPEAPFLAVPDDAQGIEETVATIGAAVPDHGYEPETGDAVLDVPQWPESTWAAPDMVDTAEPAEVIEVAPADDAAAEDLQDAAMQAWADKAEAEVVASLQADEHVYPQGMTFDEEVLRDLVRDLIREELQGALGERITRNVRKLVRSELNRVLAVTDFG
jgi:cell pole-organizing protein PopZ